MNENPTADTEQSEPSRPRTHTFAEWTWNVDLATELVADQKIQPIPVADVAPLLAIRRLDPALVAEASVLTPIIMITLPNGKGWWPIDGWETIKRAVEEDMPNVYARILNSRQTREAMLT